MVVLRPKPHPCMCRALVLAPLHAVMLLFSSMLKLCCIPGHRGRVLPRVKSCLQKLLCEEKKPVLRRRVRAPKVREKKGTYLVAPYCAIPRDYLSDTPLLPAMGFLVSQHGQLGAIPPAPFESFPCGEHVKWMCDPPPHKRGISAILARYPMRTRQMGAIPPSAILSRKGIAR